MRHVGFVAGCLLASLTFAQPAPTPGGGAGGRGKAPNPPRSPAPAATTVADQLRERTASLLNQLDDNGDWNKALREVNILFDLALAYGPVKDEALLADLAGTRLLITQLTRVKLEERQPVYALLRKHEELSRTLVFLIRPQDQLSGVYEVLLKLHAAHGEKIGEYPALASALCVVHDVPLPLMQQDDPEAEVYAEPAALFAHYVKHERRLAFSPKLLPAELLVFMVNSRAAVPEMEWAIARHAGDRNVGKRFNDLVYDTGHFKYNRPKKIEGSPYTLQNLKKYGGICGDQAYFAAHIGKSIGIPTAEIVGRGSDVGHAWVGFLQKRGSSWTFNCEEGVFGEYEKLRSSTRDPQTGSSITQSQIEVAARLVETSPSDRFAAAALLEGARRMRTVAGTRNFKWPPETDLAEAQPTRPAVDSPVQIAMMQRAAALAPFSPDVWLSATDWASVLSPAEREALFRAVSKATEHASEDFAYEITCRLIAAGKDKRQQIEAWEWLRKQYPRRPDLACQAIERKGDSLLTLNDTNGAFAAYADAAKTFCNDGPFFLTPLAKAEQLLRDGGRADLVADLFRDVFRVTSRPSTMSDGFALVSNYAQVGSRYAEVLDELGRSTEAEKVRRQIGVKKPAR